MKNYFTLLVLFLSFLVSNAQISENVSMTGMQIYTKDKTPKEYTGSPYAEKDFKRGIIYDMNKDKSQPAFLRYNAVEDVVEIRLKKNDESSVLPKFTHILYKMGDYTYFIDNLKTDNGYIEAYFARFYDGEKAKFIARPVADITEAQVAKTGYEKDKPADLGVDMVYYISIDGGEFKEVRLKERDLEDFFSSKKMEDYFDKNKIKTEGDVVKLLEYYEKNI
ncbi:hypothetical protein GCM10023115_39360 [Pontixanthobacter gangjinensis]|uniref:GLPGLI family protein n=1 Tax=Christiangramia aestuarii TaxID=1028746 RepID=A0A7K1LSW5_9FLAO|nr:hypothetical protein [Christiangramia aestuarii]MUP43867.1 hypothetical protein [Christiangramia aestuarii]